mmetsp:Transcript_23944/g.65247  ORF Transcript_23944/g.65247 Transcript_23944/m.65247 type:complete len:275 (-) Transcript_23944:120-944(-)
MCLLVLGPPQECQLADGRWLCRSNNGVIMGQQLTACQNVCTVQNAAIAPADVPIQHCSPQVKLIAWMRRRNGADCDFGAVFEELFGSREPVGFSKFEQVFLQRGFASDAKSAFQYIDRYARKGAVGAEEFDAWQNEIEDREAEGLKNLRDFLKTRYATPSAAYKDLGKGEGDVLTSTEFMDSMQKIGFVADNLEELFRFIDKDYSGEVTFSEFKDVMRHAGNRKRSPRSPSGKSPRGGSSKSPGRSQSPGRPPHEARRASRGGMVASEARRHSS